MEKRRKGQKKGKVAIVVEIMGVEPKSIADKDSSPFSH
jgi:hypothetical protein